MRFNGVKHGRSFLKTYDCSDPMAPGAVQTPAPPLAEIRHFVDCIRNDTDPFIKPEEAMVVTQIIEGIYRSAASGEEILLISSKFPKERWKIICPSRLTTIC